MTETPEEFKARIIALCELNMPGYHVQQILEQPDTQLICPYCNQIIT